MSTPTAPPKPHLRYGELKNWLGENNISERKVLSLISQGIIKPYHIGGGAAYYNAAEVERDVLNQLKAGN